MKWLFIAVGVALFAGLVAWTGPGNLAASLSRVNVPLFALSPLLSVAILFLLTVRFRIVLKDVARLHGGGGKVLGFWNLFRIFTISNVFALMSPAKSGELAKSYFLKKQGVDYGRGIIVVVVERVLDFVAISFLLMSFAALSASDYALCGAALLLLVGAGIVFFRSSLFIRLLRLVPLVSKKLKEAEAGEYKAALRRSLSPGKMAWPIAITALSIVMIAARMYVIFLSLGLLPDFATTILVYMLVIVVGILSMIPGGVGSIEVSGALLYSSVLGYDLATVATALVLLRFSTFAMDIPAGMISSYVHGAGFRGGQKD